MVGIRLIIRRCEQRKEMRNQQSRNVGSDIVCVCTHTKVCAVVHTSSRQEGLHKFKANPTSKPESTNFSGRLRS